MNLLIISMISVIVNLFQDEGENDSSRRWGNVDVCRFQKATAILILLYVCALWQYYAIWKYADIAVELPSGESPMSMSAEPKIT